MIEATVQLDRPLTVGEFARLCREAVEGCDCTEAQRAGVVAGSEALCVSCAARKWLNDGAELVSEL
jgi:hypothetical protein